MLPSKNQNCTKEMSESLSCHIKGYTRGLFLAVQFSSIKEIISKKM